MNMKKLSVIATLAIVLTLVAVPAFAQEAGADDNGVDWGILGAAFAIGLAALGGALGQSKAIAAGLSGMARNPGAAGDVRTTLIIGLAFIETLVIFALIVALRGAGLV